jgi:hypothetical protein
MKYIILIFSIIAIALIAYNVTLINFSDLFNGESTVAFITILASLCALVLLQILRISKKIEDKTKS